MLSLSGFPLPIHFLSSASLPVLTTQPLFLLFLFFPASPHSGFSGAASPPFGFLAFPLPFHPVSRVSLSFLRTRLSVRFLSPFLDSLPQLFLKCFPFALAFGLFPFLPLSFVRFRSGSGYSASVSSLPPSSRFCLTAASPVRPFCFRFFGFPRSSQPGFPCSLSRFLYSAFCLFPFALP